MAKKTQPEQTTNVPASKDDNGFVELFFKLFFGRDDPEREKRRLIKQIGKELQHQKYRFYKPKGEQALPGLAKFFYEIYKTTANSSLILQGADKSQALKSICIETFLSETQLKILERISDESIRERSKTTDPKTLSGELKDELVQLFAGFDSQKVGTINETFALVNRFLRFISFDYYFVLKKFDSSLQERNFAMTPKFEAINAEYILDDIKDFQELGMGIDKTDNWDQVFDVLKRYKSLDPVDRNDWHKLAGIIHNINQSEILSLVVRHCGKDPWYKPITDNQPLRIVEPYIEKIRTGVETSLQKLVGERREAQVDKLLVMIFGTKTVERTKYYTEKANASFSRKQTPGFTLVGPVNYAKAFLLDYFKKDVRELQELILVRGKWTTNVMSQQLSDLYYQILAVSDQIIAFDESLSDDADAGAKIRKALGRVIDKDSNSGNMLRLAISEVNEKAGNLMNETAQLLIQFGKYLRLILEDVDRKDHEVLINWKELENLSDVPLKTRMSEIYKKLYYFIQLLQMFPRGGTVSAAAQDVNVPKEE